MKVRSFALVVVDDFDNEIDRFNLDGVSDPKNLGFEIEYTTLEARLTTYFTSAKQKKVSTELTVNFDAPNAYAKSDAFRFFCQKYVNERMIFEYNNTQKIVNWEGKITKYGLTEKNTFGGLDCAVSFLPGTPKYVKKDNVITIHYSAEGKTYPYAYPYAYGTVIVENNEIQNDYFDEIPLRIYIYGATENPQISLVDEETETVYSTVKFNGLTIAEGEHLLIDAITNQILLYHDGEYTSAYDFLDKSGSYDSFLFAKENTTSSISVSLVSTDTGYVKGSYRQYVL